MKFVVVNVWSNCVELLPAEHEKSYFYWLRRKKKNVRVWDELTGKKVVVKPNIFRGVSVRDRVWMGEGGRK